MRQWVLTLPFALRFRAAYDKQVCRLMRRVFMREVLGHLRRQAREQGLIDPEAGGVCFLQRVLDGVFTRDPKGKAWHFYALAAPCEKPSGFLLSGLLSSSSPGADAFRCFRSPSRLARLRRYPGEPSCRHRL
ncbi:MAG: hypothetical protein AB1486_34975 [Planctomycetota bacterium]